MRRKNEREKKDLAMIIEETLKQRYQGVKNESGVWITPAFPKLIYVLEEDNVNEGTEYYYLTEMLPMYGQAPCSRLYSEKKMMELKEGNCFPVDGMPQRLKPWKDEMEIINSTAVSTRAW